MVHLATKKFDIRKLVFSCLLAATAVLSGCGGSSESEFEQIVRQSNCVTADQVYSDYQNNEVAAQQKYQGRVNRICGVVDEIELNLFNQPVISLDASLLGSVSIEGVDTASAANISKGSAAVFECNKINELLGNPVLAECSIVPIQNLQNEAQSGSGQLTPRNYVTGTNPAPAPLGGSTAQRPTRSAESQEYMDPPLPPKPSFSSNVWMHNGSTVRLYASGIKRAFYYENPKAGLPVNAGELLFYGSREGDAYFGLAYRFSSKCGAISYEVSGSVEPNQTTINLSGLAPKRDGRCNVIGTFVDTLKFNLLYQ